ncbi:hypothetical protein [Streptomyces griseoluteus]
MHLEESGANGPDGNIRMKREPEVADCRAFFGQGFGLTRRLP